MLRPSDTLPSLRHEIDAIDYELLELFSERARVVARVAIMKEDLGLPTRDPERETSLLLDRVSRNRGPLRDTAVAHLFREILAVSRRMIDETRRGRSTAFTKETGR